MGKLFSRFNMSSNKIQIIDYNEKSFAVIGEPTRQYKEELKGYGGRYVPYLKCGAGWIFSKKLGSKVKSFFEKKKGLIIEFAKVSSSEEESEIKIVRKNSESSSSEDEEEQTSRTKQVKSKIVFKKPEKYCSSSEDEPVKTVPTVSQKEYNEVLRQLDLSKKKRVTCRVRFWTLKNLIGK